MKNKIKFIGFISLIALIGLLISCGDKNVAVKIRASNNNGITPTQALTLATRNAGLMGLMSFVADPNFVEHNKFYTNEILGTVVSNITPTSFEIEVIRLVLYANNGDSLELVHNNPRIFDFTKNLTFDLGDIPVGTTCVAIQLIFSLPSSRITFPFPDDIGVQDNGDGVFISLHALGGHGVIEGTPGNMKGKFSYMLLDPGHILKYEYTTSYGFPSKPDINMQILDGIYYGAGARRVYHGTFSVSEVIPFATGWSDFGVENRDTLVIPLQPVTVHSGASSITFDISWDLNGIVERRAGRTNSSNDDIFILKNGWWNGLHIQVTVQ